MLACAQRVRPVILGRMPLGEDTPSKLQRVRELLQKRRLDGVWLRHHANVSWLCDGSRAHIHLASDIGVLTLFVTANAAYAITTDVERARLCEEEGMQHWQFISTPWAAPPWTPSDLLPASAAVGGDLPSLEACDLGAAILDVRVPLLPGECARLRALGAEVSASLFDAAQRLHPGLSEHAVAGAAAQAICAVGAEPVVVLVAGDDRIARVRHPLPTQRSVAHVAMVVICARRHGLVASMTRFVGWGQQTSNAASRLAQVAYVDACAIAQTRPGTPLQNIWATLQEAYAHIGHPDAWRGLHQGGPCSYAPRDTLLSPTALGQVQAMQAFAWNPSIPGAKSEDTALCTDAGTELLTLGPWPTQSIAVDGGYVRRPTLCQLG